MVEEGNGIPKIGFPLTCDCCVHIFGYWSILDQACKHLKVEFKANKFQFKSFANISSKEEGTKIK